LAANPRLAIKLARVWLPTGQICSNLDSKFAPWALGGQPPATFVLFLLELMNCLFVLLSVLSSRRKDCLSVILSVQTLNSKDNGRQKSNKWETEFHSRKDRSTDRHSMYIHLWYQLIQLFCGQVTKNFETENIGAIARVWEGHPL
jgi:hypothetical protein